jgi:hypothetical protein
MTKKKGVIEDQSKSTNMKLNRILYIIPILILFISCKSKRIYQSIDFQNNYKFNSEIQEELAKDTVAWKYQLSAGEYAINGHYKNALEQWDIAFPGSGKTLSQKQIDSIIAKYKIVPAINYIVEQAKSSQVVIINEAHYNSSHRAFTEKLLQKLYEIGYTNLGLEALTNGENIDSLLNKRGYPIQESGYYTKDPKFGNLVRTALKNGYTVFPYERTSTSNGKEREIEQAENIKSIIDKNPNQKYIIHCGFNHAFEGDVQNWEKAMAGWLFEFTGINPLTINQTKYSERSKPELNNPLLEALNLSEASVLLDENGKPLKYTKEESYTDMAVFHPITSYLYGRPNWLFDSENKEITIDLKDVNISFPVMVLAYFKDEDINTAIPTDIIEIQNKNDVGHLALKSGTYVIVVTNKMQKALKFVLKVK